MTRLMRSTLAIACLVAVASALHDFQSYHELKQVTTAPDLYDLSSPYAAVPPRGVDPAFDCAWRKGAYAYAQKIQPTQPKLRAVYDALQLDLCNTSYAREHKLAPIPENVQRKFAIKTGADATLFVDVESGNDSNPGTELAPLKTLEHAVTMSRTLGVAKRSIVMRKGTYYLSHTIELGTEDSGLTIMSYDGDDVWVSGGHPLEVNWAPFNQSGSGFRRLIGENNIMGSVPGPQVNKTIFLLGHTSTVDACEALCDSRPSCESYVWHDAQQGAYANDCYIRTDRVFSPTPEAGHISGYRTFKNIYRTRVQLPAGLTTIPSLRANGERVVRARYPNANPERDLFPTGWISKAQSWLKPVLPADPDQNIEVTSPNRGFEQTEFQYFELGVGGCCKGFTPPEGYWCSSKTSGGGAFTYRIPSGLTYSPSLQWKNATGAVVQAWRPGHWASWMFLVDDHVPATQTLKWTLGGFQGARGNDNGAEWFVENIFEELDAANEFFYDTETGYLYFNYNGTGAPPSDMQFVTTNLKTLISVVGTQEYPVRDISLQGLSFRDATYTYLDPHGMPSGGDWGLQRAGALFFEGTIGSTVAGCFFLRVDGNALFLSGFQREFVIDKNEFLYIGDSAIASWGYTNNMDGTTGNHPEGTSLTNNFFHELGLHEKQSSAWFQAKSASTFWKHNIFFNGPRAGVNVNDGFGGNNTFVESLMFNSCRESQDHGPFNSWDRQPFLTTVRDGTPSLVPLNNTIHQNYWVAGGGANGGCVDNDDGSSYYVMSSNFFVFGGHKGDFNSHSKISQNNVNAYSQVYGSKCLQIDMPIPGGKYNEEYSGCKCILTNPGDVYLNINGRCNPQNSSDWSLTLGNNQIYVPNKDVKVHCNGKVYDFADFEKFGLDTGTTIHDAASSEQIIQWGKEVLGGW